MENTALYTNYEEMPVVLSAKDISIALRVSRSTTYRLMASDGFPSVTVGRRVVVPKTAFIKWLENNAEKQLKLQ